MKKAKLTPLQKQVKKLLINNDEGEIFHALMDECEKQQAGKTDWLTTQMIEYLTINRKMNVIKPETLLQQMQLEDVVENIVIPFTHQSEIHFAY